MTFNNLLDFLDTQILGESETVEYSFGNDDARLLFLYHAACQIGSVLAIPVLEHEGTLSANATEYDPSDALNITTIEGNVMVGDYELTFQDAIKVRSQKRLASPLYPIYFNFDPKLGDIIYLSGKVASSQPIFFRYAKGIDPTSLSGTDYPWDNKASDFHWLVAVKAGARMWGAAELYGTASNFINEYNDGIQALAARFGRTDFAKLLINVSQVRQAGLDKQQNVQQGA